MIETERLILREIKIEDALDMYEYSSDEMTNRYVTYDLYKSIDDAYNSINYFFLNRDETKQLNAFAIVYKENNKMIGTVDASSIFKEDNVEVGYVLNRDYWNKGLMTEAMEVYLRYLINEKKIRRIELSHHPKNIGSQKVALKLGFVYEGLRREYIKFDGEYIDIPYYSLLEGDLNDISK